MEWVIEKFVFATKQFEFERSDRVKRELTELVVDGCVLFNMLELTGVSNNRIQVVLCDHCGLERCQPGGWLAPRRWKDRVVLIPIPMGFNESELERYQYSAPDYVSRRGCPSFSVESWEVICDKSKYLLSLDDIAPLSNRDLVVTIQYFAPDAVLGLHGFEPTIDSDNFVAVSEGDLQSEISSLALLIKDVISSDSLVSCLSLEKEVEFFLDISGPKHWRPFGYCDGGTFLNPLCVFQ